MFSMPGDRSLRPAGRVPVPVVAARAVGDVLVGGVDVWQDRVSALSVGSRLRPTPLERRRDVERRAGRREARRVLRAVAGDPVPLLDDKAVDTSAAGRPVVAVVAAPALVPVAGVPFEVAVPAPVPVEVPVEVPVVCEVCRLVPGVRRVVFADAVLALVCRCCAAGAVAGVAA